MARHHMTSDGHVPFTPEEEAEWDAMEEQSAIDAAKASIPQVVSIRQACQALEQVGKLDELEAAITQAPRWIQIDWARCQEIRRDWPAIPLVQPALGLTDVQIDDLFKLAATL